MKLPEHRKRLLTTSFIFIVFTLIAVLLFWKVNEDYSKRLAEKDNKIEELVTHVQFLDEQKQKVVEENSKLMDKNETLEKDLEIKEDQAKSSEKAAKALQEELDNLKGDYTILKNKVKASSTSVSNGLPKEEPKNQSKSNDGETIPVKATYYTAGCEGCSGITRDGTDVTNTIYSETGERIIAADPNVIPLGSTVRVDVENGNSFIAEARDTGSAIKGNRIDILVGDEQTAIDKGVKKAEVTIID